MGSIKSFLVWDVTFYRSSLQKRTNSQLTLLDKQRSYKNVMTNNVFQCFLWVYALNAHLLNVISWRASDRRFVNEKMQVFWIWHGSMLTGDRAPNASVVTVVRTDVENGKRRCSCPLICLIVQVFSVQNIPDTCSGCCLIKRVVADLFHLPVPLLRPVHLIQK